MLDLPPPQPGIEIFVASHGMSQGISQTDGVQVFPRTLARIGAAQVGAQWRNISSPLAKGVAAFFVRFNGKLGNMQLDAGAAYRIRTGTKPGVPSKAWEFSAGARRSFGKFGLRAIAEYSPQEFGRGTSLYVELGPTFEVDKATKLFANVGVRERDGGPDYRSFNGGVTRVFGRRLSLDARYYGTNRSEFGAVYGGRVVVSARLSL